MVKHATRWLCLAGGFAFLAGYAPAAGPLRCGGKLVAPGMGIDEVRRYCGAPDSSESEELPTRSGHRVVGSYIAETWIYRRGSGQPAAVLRFEDNELKTITYEP